MGAVRCDRCGQQISPEDEMDYYGQMLCEECYMHALSPARACDPWAVRSAQVLSQIDGGYSDLSKSQARILQVLRETGGVEPDVLAQQVDMELPDLERELATLRHMEKIRAKLKAGRRIICLWES